MKITKNGNSSAKNRNFTAVESKLKNAAKVKSYRNYAGLSSTDKIAEESFDDVALSRVSREYSTPIKTLKKEILAAEDDRARTLQDVAEARRDLDNPDVASETGQIEGILDQALDYNQEQIDAGMQNFQNVLLIGEAGTGKSSRVRAWAKANNINLYEVRAAGMDDTDLGGAIGASTDKKTVQRLASTEFDKLNRPNSVLFLDEYNRAPKSVRTNLLELINSHVVPDPREESGQRFLENFLFTVAAINPATSNYDTDVLDKAERTRFKNVNVVADPENLVNYLVKSLDHMIETAKTPERKQRAEGRKALVQTLLKPEGGLEFDSAEEVDKFSEDDPDYLPLNARTFTNLVMGTDGTKKDLLAHWDEYTNRFKKADAKRILANYKDVADKANQALGLTGDDKKEEAKPVFSSNKNLVDQMLDALDTL